MSSSEMGHHHSHQPQYPDSRVVSTNYGPIVGRRLVYQGEKQVDAFQGIPYAQPPVGSLRFQKPKAHTPWTEVRKCQAFGNRSIQKDGKESEKNKMPPVSEDCLFLNVFSPVWEPEDTEGFAVLVFIHGGAFLSDSTVKYGDMSICEHICKKNVVMVTLQYRLGYLGMWSTGDDHCPGNTMFWDQTFALQWIKDNIKSFNGNPNNITLMGQSAGGCSVDVLSLSPHSRDLFQKVIPMAGNASCFWSVEYNVTEACRQAAENFGVTCCCETEKYLEELRKIPAETFALSIMDMGDAFDLKLGPRLEGDFVPKHPDELRKEAPAKPRIYGLTRSEGLFMVGGIKERQKETYIYKIAAFLFPEKDFPNDFARLRLEYAAKVKEFVKEGDKDSILRAVVQAAGDEFLGIGTQKAVINSLENGDAPVYIYRMDYFNPKMYGGILANLFPYKDASHCTDISYIVAEPIGIPFKFEEDDYKVVEVMTTLWTNFAKYGDPNGKEDIPRTEKWLPATKEDPQRHLQINMESKMSSNFYEGRPLWYVENERQFKKKSTVTHF